ISSGGISNILNPYYLIITKLS
ncbi:uncharacterized protein METZ01_LOCUS346580, partial [marine metagenome]